MKATMNKILRKYQAFWIKDTTEQIVGLLNDERYLKESKDYLALEYGEKNGWLESRVVGKYLTFFFTEKGLKDICEPMKHNTCAFTGRKVRG